MDEQQQIGGSRKRKHDDKSGSDSGSKPRVLQACLPCRRRKVKCNGQRPSCQNCLRFRDSCSWPQGDGKDITTVGNAQSYLPEPEISDEQLQLLTQIFFTVPHLGIVRHCVHHPTFDIAKSNERSSFTKFAICSLSALYLPSPELKKYFPGESAGAVSSRLADHAQRLSMESSFEPCVENIQANLFLAMRELLDGTGNKAWMYAGLAIRMAQAIRLGKEYNQRHPPREREIRRRTMWTCFIMDRLVCAVTCRPQTIQVNKLMLQLPCLDTVFAFEEEQKVPNIHDFDSSDPIGNNILSYVIKAIEIWGLVSDLFASWALASPEISLASEKELNAAESRVQAWLTTLPPRMKWSPQNYRSHKAMGQGNLFCTFHLLLLHVQCITQQGYLPFGNFLGPGSNMDQIATAKCLRAADSITAIAAALKSGDESDKANLLSPFSGLAITCATNIYIWFLHINALRPMLPEPTDVTQQMIQTQTKIETLNSILGSWSSMWTLARSWLETTTLLSKFYSVAYGKEQLETEDDVREEADSNPGNEDQVAIGSGFPDPADMQQNFRRIYILTSATSESKALRQQQARLHMHNMWKQMWLSSQMDTSDVYCFPSEIGDEFSLEQLLPEASSFQDL